MEVVVVKVVRKEGSTVVTGGVGPGVGPLAGDGLDETFGFAVGLGAIRFGEEMFEAEFVAGGGEEFGAIGGAASVKTFGLIPERSEATAANVAR